MAAFRSRVPCHLKDILAALRAVYAEKGLDEDGATATMDAICRFPLFEPTQRPAEFFGRSWVVSLPAQLPEESRGLVVNLLLDALDRYLNSAAEAPTDARGNRALRIGCVIDGAHRILGTRLPGLRRLFGRVGRRGGVLISRSPDRFSGRDAEFLTDMGRVVAFSTNAKPAAAGRVLGKGINLSALASGECLAKRRGDPTARRVIAWQRKVDS